MSCAPTHPRQTPLCNAAPDGDGRWKVDVEPIKGKRFRKTFKTKGEAQRFEATCRAKVIESREWSPSTADTRRLSALIESWYDLHGHSLRDGLRRRKKLDALAKRLRDPIGSRIDPQAYAHDRRVRMEAGASPKTLNNELGYLRSAYNELRGLGAIKYENPLALVKPLKIQERELSWLTNEQIAELLESIRSGCDNPHVELVADDLPGNWGTMVRGREAAARIYPKRGHHLQQDQERQGSVGPDLAGAGKEDNEALEAPRAFHPGDNLVPACAGKNQDQATERAGRPCAAAYLRQPLHPERWEHPDAAEDPGPFEPGHDDAVRAPGAGSSAGCYPLRAIALGRYSCS